MQIEKIEQGCFYHIYNRGNNGQNIFLESINYDYFIKLMTKYLVPNFQVYSYCLLPNHFHLLLSVHEDCENPSQQFSNLFNAYTKAINKKYNRTGSLLEKPFKRIKISNEEYLKTLVLYIHQNPEKHEISKYFSTYRYSSYQSFLSESKTNISREEIINWFGDLQNFKASHSQKRSLIKLEKTNFFLE